MLKLCTASTTAAITHHHLLENSVCVYNFSIYKLLGG